jgi:cysteine-rich repeat protein
MDKMSFCKPDACGDGILWNKDECDDGNTVDFDGCSSLCKIEPGFTCESSNPDDKYGKSRCFNCGNGIIDPAEDCDDSNTEDDDGCSATCFLEKGAVYEDADGLVPEGTNFSCTKAPTTKVTMTLFVDDDANASTTTETTTMTTMTTMTTTVTTTMTTNESGADRMLATQVFATHCKLIVPYHEQNRDQLILYAAGITMTLVMSVALGALVYKWHKNKIRLKQGEVLAVGKDGRIKKVNTMTAILVCQMQLKKQVKRRRELKRMEEEALKKQEELKKKAARLQEKKWRKAMQEGPEEEGAPTTGAANNYVSDHV